MPLYAKVSVGEQDQASPVGSSTLRELQFEGKRLTILDAAACERDLVFNSPKQVPPPPHPLHACAWRRRGCHALGSPPTALCSWSMEVTGGRAP